MDFNPQMQLAGLLEWMAEQMAACRGKTAVIGISGGKDSSTVAALAVAAYGRENVYGVLMPDGVQPDIDYSQALVKHLNLPHTTINIHDAVQGVLGEMERAGLTPSRQTTVNLPSRIRMATLYAVAQSLPGGIVINTKALDLRGLLAALHLIEKGIPSGQALALGIINKAFEPFERQLVADAVWARLPRDAGRDALFG